MLIELSKIGLFSGVYVSINVRREIAFGLSLHGVPGQMRAAKIDAEERLPIPDGFMRFERHLPARAAVQLGKQPFLPQLAGG